MLIDTHSHLYFPEFKDDFEQVLDRCKENEVTTLITVGVDVKTSQIALDLESSKVKFYSTIGIHPHEAHKYIHPDLIGVNSKKMEQDIAALEKIYLKNPKKVIAVGECGLDYVFSTSEGRKSSGLSSKPTLEVFIIKNLQKKLFQAQIDLAKKLNLPLIIHCRDDRSEDPQNIEAWLDVLDLAGDYKGLLHCYSGTKEITQKALRTEFLISFAATLTYPKNDYLREAAMLAPLEKIALETDCPFLPPQSKRGQRNEPSTVTEIAQLIADLKNVSLQNVAKQTSDNVARLFAFQGQKT